MATEIERKFLVVDDRWRALARDSRRIRQGYLGDTANATVRIRADGDDRATLTIKSARSGAVRGEWEYDVPLADASALLALVIGDAVEKTRHTVPIGDLVWEIDEFTGENEGLVLAEVELSSAEQDVPLPSWVGQEVTDDDRYYNSSLALKPFRHW